MPGASLANAIKRKTHKERSQPGSRRKYGLLEKHKDYVERARDFHRKEKTIKLLKRKAEQRNPDEFYFAMEKKRTKGGVHQEQGATYANKYSADELALMRTQDVRYLTMKAQTEAQKVKKLQATLHSIGGQSHNTHIVFVEDSQQAATFDPAAHFDTPKELLGRSHNRLHVSQLAAAGLASRAGSCTEAATVLVAPFARAVKGKKGEAAGAGDAGAGEQAEPSMPVIPGRAVKRLTQKAEMRVKAAYAELQQRQARHAKLVRAAAHVAMQQEVSKKGSKRKLSRVESQAQQGAPEGSGSASQQKVYIWKRERKR